MPEPEEDKKCSNSNPNWVNVSTLVVLTATLIAGVVLAYLAYQQNELTRAALEVNSRPILTAGFLANITTQVGQKINVEAIVENVGKMPIRAHIKSNVLYSLTQMQSLGLLPAEKVQLVWPGKAIKHTAESGETLTEGQLADLRAGRGWLYVIRID